MIPVTLKYFQQFFPEALLIPEGFTIGRKEEFKSRSPNNPGGINYR
jgi:hypothetical protein